jgi:hypothetical protein
MDALAVLIEEMRALRELVEGMSKREGRPLALTYERAGAEISRGSKTIARMVQRGELLSIRGEGRSRLIATQELERWISERQQKPRRRMGGAVAKPPPSAKSEAERAREMLKRR